MRVAVIGYGLEGQSAVKYWGKQGSELTVHDGNPDLVLPKGVDGKLGPDYLKNLDGYDLIVRQQSVHPAKIVSDAPVTTVIDEFMAKCPVPVIGVTGTKGKGTTSTLITRILEAAGQTVWLGGNIGVVPLDFLEEIGPNDRVVLELSSSQLIDVTMSPQVAVCLMVVPEHLNYHDDMAEYTQAKGNIFRFQSRNDLAVYNADNAIAVELSELSAGKRVPYGKAPGAAVVGDSVVIDGVTICRTDEVGLLGPHNLQNICAAITATWQIIGGDADAVREVIKSFTGLEHRLELAGETTGVRYYDDSFATTPETAIAAIKSFDGDKVVILGGSDKGVRFDELARVVEDEHVIHALLIGDMAPVIAEALDRVGFSHYTLVKWDGMERLVETASHLTEPGDVVLLSPGCASFGLFKDYKDRGDQFKKAVASISK